MKRFLIFAAILCGIIISVFLYIAISDLLAPKVSEITFDMSDISAEPGETYALSYSYAPSGGGTPKLKWKSSDESVASVKNGVVTAKSVGTATITVSSRGGVSARCVIDVAVPVSSVAFSTEELKIDRGDSAQLSVSVFPENATHKNLSWSSDNTSVALVDETGSVTAVGSGSAVIRAVSSNGAAAECRVTVVTPVEALEISEGEISLRVSGTHRLSCTVLPEEAEDKALTWSSSNPGIASVDGDGNVTGMAAGDAVISASSGNRLTASCIVHVKVFVESLTLSAKTLKLSPGETYKLGCIVSPVSATDKTLAWSSSDTSVASVDSSGLVSAVSSGSAVITVSCADGVSAKCEVLVQALTPYLDAADTLTLMVGQSGSFNIVTKNITNPSFLFTSSNPEVASVDGAGVVTARSVGTAEITVTATNGLQTACTVRVTPAYVTYDYVFYYPYLRKRTVSLTISVADYEYYRSIPRYPIYFDSQYAAFVNDTSDDAYLASVAQALKDAAEKAAPGEDRVADFIISFVQNLNYYDDYTSTGYSEYPKYPIETLFDKGGDCEDTSILLASLLSKLGYKTALIVFSDHMAVGVAGDYRGESYTLDGVEYYYIETTGTGWSIGAVPQEYAGRNAALCAVH